MKFMDRGRRRSTLGYGFLLIGLLALQTVLTARPASALPSIETTAAQAILIDVTSDTILFEKNADQRMPTSSMSKIMTMYLVFDALKSGTLSMEDRFHVSHKAWKKGGSRMFVEVDTKVRVEDLIRGVIVHSGNDASIVLAEGLAGTEDAFARAMNEKARELGMADSHFVNATGWPDDDHYSTARDLALLARHIIQDFPEYYYFYSERSFTYNDITQRNRNPLLYRDVGADGLKTGHTNDAGYGLTASAIRDGRRLILVINGLESAQARREEALRLLEWGFREFNLYRLFDPTEVVDTAPVWLGSPNQVPLIVPGGLSVTLAPDQRDGLVVTLVMEVPVPAPFDQGTEIGKVRVSAPGMDPREVPVVAAESVARLGFLGRIAAAAGHLLFGWL